MSKSSPLFGRLLNISASTWQDADVEPDVWKIEELERHEDCEKIVAAARRQTRSKVGCIILDGG